MQAVPGVAEIFRKRLGVRNMLRLVRWQLKWHDRHPWAAPIGFCLFAQVVAFVSILVGIWLLSFSGINENLAVFILAPWMIFFAPFYWASVFLLVEQMWMLTGVSWILGMKDNALKRRIETLVKYRRDGN